MLKNVFIFGIFIFSLSSFAQTNGTVACLHPACEGLASKPAVVFGFSNKGVKQTAKSLQKNADLLQKIITHELTIKNDVDPTALGAIIAANANRFFPVEKVLEMEPALRAPGLGLLLEPTSFSTETDNGADIKSVRFLDRPNDNFASGGLDISDFNLYDLDLKYNLDSAKPSLKICGKFKLKVKTGLGIGVGVNNLEKDIQVRNINIHIQNGKVHCFKADIDYEKFHIKGIRRASSGDVLEISELRTALRNPNLDYSAPQGNLLSSLSKKDFNEVVGRALVPILTESKIQKAIETPIIILIKDIIQNKINTYTDEFFNSDIPSPASNLNKGLPAPPQIQVIRGLEIAVDQLNNKKCKSSKKSVKNALKNITWLIDGNPSFFDRSSLVAPSGKLKINCMDKLTLAQRNQIKKQIKLLVGREYLNNQKNNQAPALQVITALGKLPVDGPSLSAYIPEICLSQDILNNQDFKSKLLTDDFIANCRGAYSLLNLEAVNKALALPAVHKSMCTKTKNYKNVDGQTSGCEIKVINEKESYSEDKVDLSCAHLNPLRLLTTQEGAAARRGGDLSFNLRVNLEGCATQGKYIGLGSIKNTEIDINIKATVETQNCSDGAIICTKLSSPQVKFDKNGHKTTFLTKQVVSTIEKSISAGLPAIEGQLNQLFIQDHMKGLTIDSKFQVETTAGSPGVIGMCFKPTEEDDVIKVKLCHYARENNTLKNLVARECAGIQ